MSNVSNLYKTTQKYYFEHGASLESTAIYLTDYQYTDLQGKCENTQLEPLPDAYREVAALKNSGGYIDLPASITNASSGVSWTIICTGNYILSGQNDTWYIGTANNVYMLYSLTYSHYYYSTISNAADVCMSYDYHSKLISINNGIIDTISLGNPKRLFAYNTSISSGTIDRFVAYNAINGTKIGDLRPCIRKSDNVCGMYDTVSNTFLTNSNTSGTFDFDRGYLDRSKKLFKHGAIISASSRYPYFKWYSSSFSPICTVEELAQIPGITSCWGWDNYYNDWCKIESISNGQITMRLISASSSSTVTTSPTYISDNVSSATLL